MAVAFMKKKDNSILGKDFRKLYRVIEKKFVVGDNQIKLEPLVTRLISLESHK